MRSVPDPVAPSVTAIFLAAAARACDDPAKAERLEALVDARYLRRENGRLWLDLDPLWRIGATAARLTSLAESRGSRFRCHASGIGSYLVIRLRQGGYAVVLCKMHKTIDG